MCRAGTLIDWEDEVENRAYACLYAAVIRWMPAVWGALSPGSLCWAYRPANGSLDFLVGKIVATGVKR